MAGAGTIREDVDLVEITRRLFGGKWLIAGLVVAGLLASVLRLHLAERQYRAELRIAPAASSMDGSNRLGALGGLAAAAGLSLGGSSQGVTPFEFHLETLQSRALAASLAEDPAIMRVAFRADWDAEAGQWREPRSLRRSVTGWMASVLGIRSLEWRQPGATELQEFIRKNVVIERPDAKDPPVTRLAITHPDPVFSVYLLGRMNQVADDSVRRNDLETARSYAAYLSEKLRAEQVAEYRRDLSEALGEQEKSIMLASSSAPYAAKVIEPPGATPGPVSPNAVLTLLTGVFAGAMIGCVIVLLDLRSLWRRIR